MMKRTLITAATIAILAGCSFLHHDSIAHHKTSNTNPYEKPPFYTQWTKSKSPLDTQINSTVAALRADPSSAPLHNQLGQLLMQKSFPKDAEREFERAVDSDPKFFQAWYNLGLVRASRDDNRGAERAFRHTVRLAKGHSEALFQLGLIEEARGNNSTAIDDYAKALRHNPSLIDVRTNPRVLDSKLMTLALLKNYERDHAGAAGRFLPTPAGYAPPNAQKDQAPSPQATAQQIVTPSAPVTDQAKQPVLPPKTTT